MNTLPLRERRTAVYRFFNGRGELLYVGVTFDPNGRFMGHRGSQWWDQVARFTSAWHPTRRAALREEAVAIATEAPIYNIAKPDPRRYLGLDHEQAAAQLKAPVPWIRRKIAAGHLPHSCSGGYVWFDDVDLLNIAFIRTIPERFAPGRKRSQRAMWRAVWPKHCPHLI